MSTQDASGELDRLAEAFVELLRHGASPTIESYAVSHPELADDIRSLFPMLLSMEAAKGEALPSTVEGELGDFRLIREIGRGGMGVVYEAEQKTLGRRVALKVLPTSTTQDPRYVERFRMEAQAAGRLQHPSIVPVIGYGEDEGVHYYTMQFVDGRGLDRVIRDVASLLDQARPASPRDTVARALLAGTVTDALPEDAGALAAGAQDTRSTIGRRYFENATRVILQAAEGVAAAHAQGVLHRDIKPSNLLLQGRGKVWITDFGLCKEVGAGEMTRTGEILGSLRYLPPERLQGHSDAQGDVYGLGVTLYELLLRRPAYPDEDPVSLVARLASDDPPAPRAVDPRVPRDLETIVQKAIARERSQRYATADAMASDLRAFLGGRPIAARAPTFGYYLRSAVRRHRSLAVTGALALLVLIASSVFYVLSLRDKERTARFQNYVARIGAAEAALGAWDAPAARRLLDAAPPEYRNWEWYALHARLDRSVRTRRASEVGLRGVAYSPDGAWLATGADGTTWLHAEGATEPVRSLKHAAGVNVIRWSPSGDRIAFGTRSGLELFSWPEGARLRRTPEAGDTRAVAFSPDGRRLATGGYDGMLRIRDVASGEVRQTLAVHSTLQSVAFDPTGKRVVVSSWDGRVAVWDLDTGRRAWSVQVASFSVHGAVFVSKEHVACPSAAAFTSIRSAATGDVVRLLSRQYQPASTDVAVSVDRRFLAVGMTHGVQVWDTRSWRHVVTWHDRIGVKSIAFHPTSTRIATVARYGHVREWSVSASGDPDLLLGHIDDVHAVDHAHHAGFFVTAGRGGVIRQWDARTGEQRRAWIGHRWSVAQVRVSPDDRWVAAGDAMGEVLLWDTRTDAAAHVIVAHEGGVQDLAFSPDGRALLSCGADGRVARWDVASGREVARQDVAPRGVTALTLTNGGRTLVAADRLGTLHLLDAVSLRIERRLSVGKVVITGLASDAAGERIAACTVAGDVHVLKGSGLKRVHTLRATTSTAAGLGLLDVQFSPSGSRIASSSRDGTVRLWDTASGHFVASLGGHHAWVHAISFGPEGKQLVSVTGAAEVRIWDTRPVRERRALHGGDAVERAVGEERLAAATRRTDDPDAALRDIQEDEDVSPTVREHALRVLHARRATEAGLIARLWRKVLPRVLDLRERWVARGLSADLVRAGRHRGVQDSQRATLWAALTYRCGDHALAVARGAEAVVLNRGTHPDRYGVDLAFLAMAHAGLRQPTKARAALGRLETLLASDPALGVARLRALTEEAREAVEALEGQGNPQGGR